MCFLFRQLTLKHFFMCVCVSPQTGKFINHRYHFAVSNNSLMLPKYHTTLSFHCFVSFSSLHLFEFLLIQPLQLKLSLHNIVCVFETYTHQVRVILTNDSTRTGINHHPLSVWIIVLKNSKTKKLTFYAFFSLLTTMINWRVWMANVKTLSFFL